MKLLNLPIVVSLATTATAVGLIQLRWFDDAVCAVPIGSVMSVTWAEYAYSGKKNCFNFEWGKGIEMLYRDAPSINGGWCDFYFQQNCGGGAVYRVQDLNKCFNQQGTKSFACYFN